MKLSNILSAVVLMVMPLIEASPIAEVSPRDTSVTVPDFFPIVKYTTNVGYRPDGPNSNAYQGCYHRFPTYDRAHLDTFHKHACANFVKHGHLKPYEGMGLSFQHDNVRISWDVRSIHKLTLEIHEDYCFREFKWITDSCKECHGGSCAFSGWKLTPGETILYELILMRT